MSVDVESHAEEAKALGNDEVTLEKFHGSAHVMHLRADEARYWKIVRDAWDPSARKVISEAPEPSSSLPSDKEMFSSPVSISSAETIVESASPSSMIDADEHSAVEDLDPSILGTKEYWDTIYLRGL